MENKADLVVSNSVGGLLQRLESITEENQKATEKAILLTSSLKAMSDLVDRAEKGEKKYGVMLEEATGDDNTFLQHAYEESLDKIQYLEKVKTITPYEKREELMDRMLKEERKHACALAEELLKYKQPKLFNMSEEEALIHNFTVGLKLLEAIS